MSTEFLQLMENWDGFRPVRSAARNKATLVKFMGLINNTEGRPSHLQEYLMKEAVTTSDFPNLFGGVLDAMVLARYRTASSEWRTYTKTGRCRDFRVRNLEKVQGQTDPLPLVPEKTGYPMTPSANAHYTIHVHKRGRQFDISWESLINDYLDAFGDIPERFADAALNTEAFQVTSLYCGAAAPAAALFGAPIVDIDGQAVTNLGVLPLTIANLQTTLGLMAAQTDVLGNPLGIRGVHLVVPPLLEFTARQALTSALVQQVDTAGAANVAATTIIPLPTSNILPQMGLRLHVDPWIPIVMPVAAANRTWFLFADYNQGAAMEMDFLAGHETPEIVMKASNKASVGAGSINPLEGDFESDNVLYRVRHVLGGSALDPRFAYAQVGP